jgi:hypothetical protein
MRAVWVALVVGAALAIAVTASARVREGAPPCAATAVHYGKAPGVAGALAQLPWVSAGSLRGYLFYYRSVLGDGRVNAADGLVGYVGRSLSGVQMKILWVPRARAAKLVIAGRRLDGAGAFRHRLAPANDGSFPSILDIPAAGCWQLSLSAGHAIGHVVVQAVDAPAEPLCDTYTSSGAGLLALHPNRAGLQAAWGWFDEQGRAQIYTHGKAPNNASTKVLWIATRGFATSLTLVGSRLDAPGNFRQTFPEALSPAGNYPSIVDVPAPGCWLFVARTGSLGGIVVTRAADAPTAR